MEAGDDYIRRCSTFVRTNERALAESGLTRRRRPVQQKQPDTSLLNPLGWFGLDGAQTAGPPPKPIVLALDTHRLFYLLMRMEAIGLNIGSLDVKVDGPTRPMSYINLFAPNDTSDSLSIASFRSSMSSLSLGGSWWGKPVVPSVDAELKYLFSSFTKLPALSVGPPTRKLIAELAREPPNENAIPLDAFKSLQTLECIDVDPRTLLGWDKLSISLRSLTIKKSGIEDVSDIFVGAVLDDQARREGGSGSSKRKRISHGPSRQASYFATRLPDTVVETEEPEEETPETPPEDVVLSTPKLASLSWAFLIHLSLADNALTFFPSEPLEHLTSLKHLDLSSNLLVSVPPGLSTLFNLISLNLSDNMIDSVLGIYTNLGQVLSLNISRNRLESICGLERLRALERVDLRQNLIDESAEIGRLATLPNIAEVWIEGNIFVEYEENYRTTCFDYFRKEGKTVLLDGTAPGFYEKRNLSVGPSPQMTSSRRMSTAANSPPVVAVGGASPSFVAADSRYLVAAAAGSSTAAVGASPAAVVARKKKKVKRIVELNGEQNADAASLSIRHGRAGSEGGIRALRKPKPRSLSPPTAKQPKSATQHLPPPEILPGPPAPRNPMSPTPLSPTPSPRPALKARHSRYQTEYTSSPTSPAPAVTPEFQTPGSFRRMTSGSATYSSGKTSRRARASTSMYEPAGFEGEGRKEDAAVEYRRRMEALRADMGDGWLKVFNQSQMGSPASGVASG